MSERRWLRLILALFVVVGVLYAVVTPVFEASDELWHYPMVRHLADGNPLPAPDQTPAPAADSHPPDAAPSDNATAHPMPQKQVSPPHT